MKNILVVISLLSLSLPVKANDLDSAVMLNWAINQPTLDVGKKIKKVKELPNGNIIYKGTEYTPVIKTSETK